jgi:hypothetical protein
VASTAIELIPHQFMVHIKPTVDPLAHIEKVNAAINSTASCGGSVKSTITDTSVLENSRFYTATLSPAMQASLQKNPEVMILEQDSKVSPSSFELVRRPATRRPATRREVWIFGTAWCVFEDTFCS